VAQKTTAITAFQIFENVVIRLYDGGVMSPAVLERVIGAFAQANVDWHRTATARAVDGRSLHEIVALTMLPGQPVQSTAASFMSVIDHIASVTSHAASPSSASEQAAPPKPSRRRKAAPPVDDAEADSDSKSESESESEELLAPLSGNGKPSKRRQASKEQRPASGRGYNPFVNAQLPRSKKP
jgi:hypothetical protein